MLVHGLHLKYKITTRDIFAIFPVKSLSTHHCAAFNSITLLHFLNVLEYMTVLLAKP